MPSDLDPSEKEERQVERLINKKPAPSRKYKNKNGPKHDNRRKRIKEDDPDLDTFDKDLSLNYKYANPYIFSSNSDDDDDDDSDSDSDSDSDGPDGPGGPDDPNGPIGNDESDNPDDPEGPEGPEGPSEGPEDSSLVPSEGPSGFSKDFDYESQDDGPEGPPVDNIEIPKGINTDESYKDYKNGKYLAEIEKIYVDLFDTSVFLADQFHDSKLKDLQMKAKLLDMNLRRQEILEPRRINPDERHATNLLKRKFDQYIRNEHDNIKRYSKQKIAYGDINKTIKEIVTLWNDSSDSFSKKAGILKAIRRTIEESGLPNSVKSTFLASGNKIKDANVIKDIITKSTGKISKKDIKESDLLVFAAVVSIGRILEKAPQKVDYQTFADKVDPITEEIYDQIQQLFVIDTFISSFEDQLDKISEKVDDAGSYVPDRSFSKALTALDHFINSDSPVFDVEEFNNAFVQSMEERYGSVPESLYSFINSSTGLSLGKNKEEQSDDDEEEDDDDNNNNNNNNDSNNSGNEVDRYMAELERKYEKEKGKSQPNNDKFDKKVDKYMNKLLDKYYEEDGKQKDSSPSDDEVSKYMSELERKHDKDERPSDYEVDQYMNKLEDKYYEEKGKEYSTDSTYYEDLYEKESKFNKKVDDYMKKLERKFDEESKKKSTKTSTYHGIKHQGHPSDFEDHKSYKSIDKRYISKEHFNSILKTAKDYMSQEWFNSGWNDGAVDAPYRSALDLAIYTADSSKYQSKIDFIDYNWLLARLMDIDVDLFSDTLVSVNGGNDKPLHVKNSEIHVASKNLDEIAKSIDNADSEESLDSVFRDIVELDGKIDTKDSLELMKSLKEKSGKLKNKSASVARIGSKKFSISRKVYDDLIANCNDHNVFVDKLLSELHNSNKITASQRDSLKTRFCSFSPFLVKFNKLSDGHLSVAFDGRKFIELIPSKIFETSMPSQNRRSSMSDPVKELFRIASQLSVKAPGTALHLMHQAKAVQDAFNRFSSDDKKGEDLEKQKKEFNAVLDDLLAVLDDPNAFKKSAPEILKKLGKQSKMASFRVAAVDLEHLEQYFPDGDIPDDWLAMLMKMMKGAKEEVKKADSIDAFEGTLEDIEKDLEGAFDKLRHAFTYVPLKLLVSVAQENPGSRQALLPVILAAKKKMSKKSDKKVEKKTEKKSKEDDEKEPKKSPPKASKKKKSRKSSFEISKNDMEWE